MADAAKRRSVFIFNIPPSSSAPELETFLLQELESMSQDRDHLLTVLFPISTSNPQLALATFQNEKAMVALMRRRLRFGGEHLTMQPFLSEVFTSITALINPDVTELFPFNSVDFTKLLEKRSGVECRQLEEREMDRHMAPRTCSLSQDLYVLTGNWYQLQNARKFMQEWVVELAASHTGLMHRGPRAQDLRTSSGDAASSQESTPEHSSRGQDTSVRITEKVPNLSIVTGDRVGHPGFPASGGTLERPSVDTGVEDSITEQQSLALNGISRAVTRNDNNVDVHRVGPSESSHPTSQNREELVRSNEKGSGPFMSDRESANGAIASAMDEIRSPENGPSPFLSDREAFNEAAMYGNAHLKKHAASANYRRGITDSSGREVTSSRTSGAAALPYKSPLVSADELSVGSSVDYMKQVRVPQTPLTSSSEPQTHKTPEDDTQNAEQMHGRGYEDAVSRRSDVQVDATEPVASGSTHTNRRALDDEGEEPAEGFSSLPVDPGVFSYILLKESDSIRGVEEKYGVKFSMHVAEDTDDTDVESALLKITPTSETAEIVRAHDEFVELYSNIFSILKHRVITVEDRAIDLDSLDKAVEHVHKYYKTVLVTVSPKRVLVYGRDESDVRFAKAWLVESLRETPVDGLTQRGLPEIERSRGEPPATSRSFHPNPVQPHPGVGPEQTEHPLIRGGNLSEEQRSKPFPRAHTRLRDELKPSSVSELGQPSDTDIRQQTQLKEQGLRHLTNKRMNGPFTRIEDEPVDYQHKRGPEGAHSPGGNIPSADVVRPSSDDNLRVSGGSDGTVSPADRPNHLDGAGGTTDDVIPVDPGVFAYIQSQKHTILCDMEQNYGIKLNVKGTLESDVYMVEVVPQGVASERTTQKGKEAFVDFYSEVFSGLDHRAISLGDFESISQEALDDIMHEIEHLFSDVLFRVVGSKVLIYGQGRHNVDSARDMVLDRLRRRSMLSLPDPSLEHEDDMSIVSLGSDSLLSRLNHLRYGSLSPEGLRGQMAGLTLSHVSADSPAGKRESPSSKETVDLNVKDLGLRHHSPSSVVRRMSDVSHEQLESTLLNGSPEATDGPVESPPHSVRHATDAISSNHTDDVTDAAQHDNIRSRNVKDGTYRLRDDRLIVDLTSGIHVQVYLKDITTIRADAIVNAANETLSNLSGIAGAIRLAAGEVMQADCNRHIAHHGLLYPAKVVHTGAGNLPCRFVMHAVGPRWLDYPDKQQCRQTLKATIMKCLQQADEKLQVRSLAMPFISSGIFRVPFEICIEEICGALLDFSQMRPSAPQGNLQEVHLVDIDRDNISEAQDIMLRTLHLEVEAEGTSEIGSDEVDAAENLSEHGQGRNGGFDNLERGDPPFAGDDEVSERSLSHRGGSAVTTRSRRRKSNSSDEDMPHEKAMRGRTGRKTITSGRQTMVRSTSLPYLPMDDSSDAGTSSWTSRIQAPPRRDQKGVENTASGKKPIRAWEKVQEPLGASSAPKETRQEQKVRELLDAYSRAPLSRELSRKTEFEINRILSEQERGAREKQPRPKRRSQSLDRRPRDKCFVCSSTRKLSKRKSCEHFICETCKLARLDVGRCKECQKHPEKKCDLCLSSNQSYLLNCRGCDKSVCIQCIRKGLDKCQDCMDQMRPAPERQKEKKQPKLRESIVGTRPSRVDTKKGYRIKSGSSATDPTGTRRKPMLGLNQPLDVAGQTYCTTTGMNGLTASKSSPLHQAFTKEFVTEEAPHEDILRRLNREQEARPQMPSKVKSHTSPLGYSSQTTPRHIRKRASKEDSLEVGQGSAPVPRQEQATCVICMDLIKNPRVLSKCKHVFCSACIETSLKFKPICPICGESYGQLRGNQPDGDMNYTTVSSDLPGYPGCGTIVITYRIPDGVQSSEHPNPGQMYYGSQREAYLPNNREGQEVLWLLKRAFEARLVFTIGCSVTTGLDNTVVWNDIHHKTRQTGGAEQHGYPDPGYLQRVKGELEAKGIK